MSLLDLSPEITRLDHAGVRKIALEVVCIDLYLSDFSVNPEAKYRPLAAGHLARKYKSRIVCKPFYCDTVEWLSEFCFPDFSQMLSNGNEQQR